MNPFDHVNLSGRRKLSMVFASEAAECGLACIAMIARYHGHDVDLNGLRRSLRTVHRRPCERDGR